MDKYLEYYQFHETDENGNTVCLYCVAVQTRDGRTVIQFIEDYDDAIGELKDFAYDNQIYTTEELKKNSHLHLQISNDEFREQLKKRFNYDTSQIDNFHNMIDHDVEVEKQKPEPEIYYEEVMPEKPERWKFKKPKILEKLKNLKFKGVKRLAVRLGIIATVGVVGFFAVKGCSKKGTTEDLVIDNQMVEAENRTKNDDRANYDVQDPIDVETNKESNFQTYLNQSDAVTKEYMTKFKENLGAFNGVARNYIDASKNSRLGLDTNNFTAFQMGLLGSDFGTYADNVSSYWYYDDLYENYVKTNDQLKQLATVQKQSSGLAKVLATKEQQDFYKKYEDMIIDLNKTSDDREKITKAENILSEIKKDFNMDSEDYNPSKLLRSDSKYIAVIPMVRSVYDRAKNSNYDNTPTAENMKELSKAYRSVVGDNILKALDSIEVKESITPSYEMYTDEIARLLGNVNLYVIDDERSVRDTELYKQNSKLPEKVIEVTATPTPVEVTPTVTEAPVATTDESVPVYSYTDDNYDYQESSDSSSYETADTTDTTTDVASNDNSEEVNTSGSDNNTVTEEPSITDQIIESDEGTDEITNDNNSTDDTISDDNQIIEKEEDIADSMNDTINNGGYAEEPDGWQIDNDYKIDGTDVIDGSVSDITIEDSNTDSSTVEEVPTTDNNNNYDIVESEEEYVAPSTDVAEESVASGDSVVIEEVPTYDESSYSTDSYEDVTTYDDTSSSDTYEEAPTYDETSYSTDTYDDVTTYEEASLPVEQTVAKMTQDEAIDQVINYNAAGMNAVPIFNASDNSWRVEVVNNAVVDKPAQYNI